jgi:hypothetical protein
MEKSLSTAKNLWPIGGQDLQHITVKDETDSPFRRVGKTVWVLKGRLAS